MSVSPGVLLLNACLTVKEREPNSHAGKVSYQKVYLLLINVCLTYTHRAGRNWQMQWSTGSMTAALEWCSYCGEHMPRKKAPSSIRSWWLVDYMLSVDTCICQHVFVCFFNRRSTVCWRQFIPLLCLPLEASLAASISPKPTTTSGKQGRRKLTGTTFHHHRLSLTCHIY